MLPEGLWHITGWEFRNMLHEEADAICVIVLRGLGRLLDCTFIWIDIAELFGDWRTPAIDEKSIVEDFRSVDLEQPSIDFLSNSASVISISD